MPFLQASSSYHIFAGKISSMLLLSISNWLEDTNPIEDDSLGKASNYPTIIESAQMAQMGIRYNSYLFVEFSTTFGQVSSPTTVFPAMWPSLPRSEMGGLGCHLSLTNDGTFLDWFCCWMFFFFLGGMGDVSKCFFCCHCSNSKVLCVKINECSLVNEDKKHLRLWDASEWTSLDTRPTWKYKLHMLAAWCCDVGNTKTSSTSYKVTRIWPPWRNANSLGLGRTAVRSTCPTPQQKNLWRQRHGFLKLNT